MIGRVAKHHSSSSKDDYEGGDNGDGNRSKELVPLTV